MFHGALLFWRAALNFLFMAHSVQNHLALAVADYDLTIRRLVPHYQEAHDEVIRTVAELRPAPAHAVDLGAGTGAMAASFAQAFPLSKVTLLDADSSMLDQARLRLGDNARFAFIHGSFFDRLPPSSVAMASLSLHHVHEKEAKLQLYTNVFRSLEPGGMLVTADSMQPKDASLTRAIQRRWAEHLRQGGDSESQAFQRFAEWAVEDRYFSIEEELHFLANAGFQATDVRWRRGTLAVLVAMKH